MQHYPPSVGSWPDTETTINRCIRNADLLTMMIGEEENYKIEVDAHRIHARSYTGAKLYAPAIHQRLEPIVHAIIAEMNQRFPPTNTERRRPR